MSNLTRNLSQVLLSKIGGNVDHNIMSVLCELIDNSLDSRANNISINTIESNNNKFLIISDNGRGMQDIDNILLAHEGKVNKIGCKNQGFLDSLAFLSNITGELDIFTNFEGNFSRISIDFTPLNEEYQTQLETDNIDYNKCQKILESNYDKTKNRNTKEYLDRNPKILEIIKGGGTYIKIQLSEDFDLENFKIRRVVDKKNTKGICPEIFQCSYNEGFKLNFMGQDYVISNVDNICMTPKYIPALFKCYMSRDSDNSIVYKFTNNFNTCEGYYKKQTIMRKITSKEEYNNLISKCDEKEILIGGLQLTLISDVDATTQQIIFDESNIETQRQLWILYQGKTLGPFKYPTKIKISYRNMCNVRVQLTVNDSQFMKNIIMVNKSQTNIDKLDSGLIKFLSYCKYYFNITYDTKIGKEFKVLRDSKTAVPGIPNMVEYLKAMDAEEKAAKEHAMQEKIRAAEEAARDAIEIQQQLAEAEAQRLAKIEQENKDKARRKRIKIEAARIQAAQQAAEEAHRAQEELEFKKKEKERLDLLNYQKWKSAVYFGMLGCTPDGISAKDNYISCRFGTTNNDPANPKHTDNLGNDWRCLFYTYVNKEGMEPKESRYTIEYELHNSIKSIGNDYNIIWETTDCFKCPKDKFNIIYKEIRRVIDIYEGEW